MPAPLELPGVVSRGAMRFLDENARQAHCRVAVFGPDGAPLAGEAPAALTHGTELVPATAACPVLAFDRVVGFVVASAIDAADHDDAAGRVASHSAAVLSELCAREYELNDLSREILGGFEELNLFYDLAGELAGAADAEAVCRIVLAKARSVIGARAGRVLLADGARDVLRVAATSDVGAAVGAAAADVGRAGAAFQSGEPEIVDDVSRLDAASLLEFERTARNLVTVPLIVVGRNDWSAIGVLQLRDKADGAAFTAADLKLARAIANQAAARIQNSRLVGIERELRIARTIQQRLLPGAPPRLPGLDVAGSCVPASSVGGDYFDHIASGPTSLALLVADVSGHDLAAALLQTAARGAFRTAAMARVAPAEVVRRASRALRDDLARAEMFLTAWFGQVDAETGTLTFCDAGHPPAVLWRAATGAVSRLATNGIPIGVGDDEAFDEARVVLEPGDVVVAFTDGLTEACASGEAPRFYGEDRLAAAVARSASRPAAEIVREVLDDVARFAGGGAAGDDRTLVVLRFEGPILKSRGTALR